MTMRNRIRTGCVIICSCLALASSSGATRVAKLPTQQLFQQSVLVFIGTAREAPEACKGVDNPCTGVAFTDLEILAGKANGRRQLEFALPEGLLSDGTSLKVAGAPEFLAGERYLIFVRAGDWHLTPATNWFHSVFRELQVGTQGQQPRTILFVDQDGRAVTGIGDNGFQLGGRISPPDRLLRPAELTSGGAQFRQLASRPPTIDAQAKSAVASHDAQAFGRLGMPKDRLLEAIAEYAKKYRVNETEPIQLRSSKSGLHDAQHQREKHDPGLQKASVERPRFRRLVFRRRAMTRPRRSQRK